MILPEVIYNILVEEAGATDDESNQLQFENFWLSGGPNEYRFVGKLGFGGKFWMGRDEWRVSCYREDETTERLEIIERTNARLAALREQMTARPFLLGTNGVSL